MLCALLCPCTKDGRSQVLKRKRLYCVVCWSSDGVVILRGDIEGEIEKGPAV